MTLAEILSIIVPTVSTIIGFVITYISLTKNFKNELQKEKIGVYLDKMATIPYEVLDLMDKIIDANGTKKMDSLARDMKSLLNTIYSYGTKDAIKIISLMQKENYAFAKNSSSFNQYRVMSLYALLATQIKYDITGILVSPNLWFQMKLTDYSTGKEKIMEANNILVDELGLKRGLKIE